MTTNLVIVVTAKYCQPAALVVERSHTLSRNSRFTTATATGLPRSLPDIIALRFNYYHHLRHLFLSPLPPLCLLPRRLERPLYAGFPHNYRLAFLAVRHLKNCLRRRSLCCISLPVTSILTYPFFFLSLVRRVFGSRLLHGYQPMESPYQVSVKFFCVLPQHCPSTYTPSPPSLPPPPRGRSHMAIKGNQLNTSRTAD